MKSNTLLTVILLSVPLAALANPPKDKDKDKDKPKHKPKHAEVKRYVSAHIGISGASDWHGRRGTGAHAANASLDLKRGVNFGLAWGKQRGPARYEIEYQHGAFDIDRATLGKRTEAVDASGHYDVLTLNALRHAKINHATSVYGGVGLGIGRASLPHIPLAAGCTCLPQADKTGLAWQARGGIERRVSKDGLVFGQLGYLRVPGPKADGPTSIKYRSKGFGVLSIGWRQQF